MNNEQLTINNEQLTMFYPPRRSQSPPSRCLLPTGFTLVEILIVISIMALLAVGSFVYFKDFSARQYTNKAVGQVQSLLRLAQSNATSATLCNGQGAVSWYLVLDTGNIDLHCGTVSTINAYSRSYPLENATASVKCGTSDMTLPVTISYSPLSGQVSFNGCNSDFLLITVTNAQNLTLTKGLTISKGGAVNVQ